MRGGSPSIAIFDVAAQEIIYIRQLQHMARCNHVRLFTSKQVSILHGQGTLEQGEYNRIIHLAFICQILDSAKEVINQFTRC